MITVADNQLIDAIKSIQESDGYSQDHYLMTLRMLLAKSSYSISEELAAEAFRAIRNAHQNPSAARVLMALQELLLPRE